MARLGIADTTFARYDMAAAASDTLRREGAQIGADVELVQVTVPGVKGLPVACLRLLEDGCDLVLALGMVGRAPIDKVCGHEVSAAIQQVMLATRRHVLEVFVHEDEARDDDDLARLFDGRTREHALNALRMLFAPDGPGWSVPRSQLRAAKEGLRRRLYHPGERRQRDVILRRLSDLYARWRAEAHPRNARGREQIPS